MPKYVKMVSSLIFAQNLPQALLFEIISTSAKVTRLKLYGWAVYVTNSMETWKPCCVMAAKICIYILFYLAALIEFRWKHFFFLSCLNLDAKICAINEYCFACVELWKFEKQLLLCFGAKHEKHFSTGILIAFAWGLLCIPAFFSSIHSFSFCAIQWNVCTSLFSLMWFSLRIPTTYVFLFNISATTFAFFHFTLIYLPFFYNSLCSLYRAKYPKQHKTKKWHLYRSVSCNWFEIFKVFEPVCWLLKYIHETSRQCLC